MASSIIYANRNLNAYFDMKRFENSIYNKTLIREERIKIRKKQKIIDNILFFTLIILTIIFLTLMGLVAYRQLRINRLDFEIAKQERLLEQRRVDTKSKNNELKSEIKYDNLKMKAYLDLNMVTPTEKNIIYFDKSDQGFVRQYENIR